MQDSGQDRSAPPLRRGRDEPTLIAQATSSAPSSDRVHPASDRVPPRLGPYTLTRLIASGGMGAVWEAIDGRLGRRVAIKVMLRSDAPVEAVERFEREALHVAKLDHPNIIAVHDVGRDRGRAYLVMDLIEGPTLAEALRDRPMSWHDKVVVVERIARAAHYAHGQGVIHRDLKPANVMLRRPVAATRSWRQGSSTALTPAAAVELGEPLLTDFGLARDASDASRLSLDGQALGTPSYMPPEQALGDRTRIGPRCDVYGLGAILYECLTGRPPFTGETPAHIMRSVVEDDPIAPSQIVPRLPRDLETICLRCLAKQPEHRYATAEAVAEDLGAWLRGDPIVARRPSTAERLARRVRRNPAAWAIGSSASVLLVVGVVVLVVVLERGRTAAVEHAAELDGAMHGMRAEQARRQAAEDERQRLQRDRAREWQTVFDDRFADDHLDERWQIVTNGGWSGVSDHALHLRDGAPQAVAPRGQFAGDVRIEFTMRQRGPILSDVSCFVSARPDAATWSSGGSGYLFQFGGRANTLCRLSRDGAELAVVPDAATIEPDHEYHVLAERQGDRLRYVVDDHVLFDFIDPQPLDGPERTCVGIYGFNADTWISQVRVARLAEPKSADLLEVIERHLDRDEAIDAPTLLDDVAATASDPDRVRRTQRARERAAEVRGQNLAFERVRAAVVATWPTAPVERVGGGIRVDLSGRDVRALSTIAGMPIARLLLGGSTNLDLAQVATLPLIELDIRGTGVASLAPLARLRLERLQAASNRVTDAGPLAGMPLKELDLSFNGVEDLSPLRGMPLASLDIRSLPIHDLVALAGAPLAHLDCSNDRIASLEPLRNAPLLELDMSATGVSDLGPLRGLPLRDLVCADDGIEDLSPLADTPLALLQADRNRIGDLRPLRGKRLYTLALTDNRIADLSPLAGQPIVLAYLGGNPFSDIGPLARSGALQVDLSRTRVTDLTGLRGLPLQDLRIVDDAVDDIAPVADAPLETLDCSGSGLRTLRGLRVDKLRELRIDRTRIADLAFLRGARRLQRLWCSDTAVTSIEPVASAPLDELCDVGAPVRDNALLAATPPAVLLVDARDGAALRQAWRTSAPRGPAGRRLCSGQAQELRGIAIAVHGHRFAVAPGWWTWDEARIVARSLGGHLAALGDLDEQNAVAALTSGWAWVGLVRSAGAMAWADSDAPATAAPPSTPTDGLARYVFGSPLGSPVFYGYSIAKASLQRYPCLVEWDD